MKSIKIKNTTIEMYDSIRELPITRYIEYQKLLLIDSGIGSTMEDVLNHFNKTFAYMQHQKYPEANNELQNMYRNIFAIVTGETTSLSVFAIMIHKIGNEFCNDITESGIYKTMDRLKALGITYEMINSNLEEVKKNYTLN